MNSNGKAARKQTGLKRSAIHFAFHTHKSQEKRQRSGWARKGKLPTKTT